MIEAPSYGALRNAELRARHSAAEQAVIAVQAAITAEGMRLYGGDGDMSPPGGASLRELRKELAEAEAKVASFAHVLEFGDAAFTCRVPDWEDFLSA